MALSDWPDLKSADAKSSRRRTSKGINHYRLINKEWVKTKIEITKYLIPQSPTIDSSLKVGNKFNKFAARNRLQTSFMWLQYWTQRLLPQCRVDCRNRFVWMICFFTAQKLSGFWFPPFICTYTYWVFVSYCYLRVINIMFEKFWV